MIGKQEAPGADSEGLTVSQLYFRSRECFKYNQSLLFTSKCHC
jgi:hypothetical protein